MDFLINLFTNKNEIYKINYEDIQFSLNKNNFILINTLEKNNQKCLIKNTISIDDEVKIINKLIENNNNINIIVYGENSNSEKIFFKYEQLKKLGFTNVYVYTGGLFEWLSLQDIYGFELFPTTSKELDILKYKSKSIFNTYLLKN